MFNVQITTKRQRRDNLLDLSLVVNKKYRTILKINSFSCFSKFITEPSPLSLDILYFTSIVYTIDKLIPRSDTFDNWCRDIDVTIPVSNVSIWEKSKSELKNALDFLTSDNWNISFSKVKRPYFQKKKNILPLNASIDNICLFSGGLDSLAGGINLADETNNILFISHIDGVGASKKIQEPLLEKIKESYPDKYIEHSPFHVFSNTNNEDTTRGRSILFLGFALFHAINLNVDKVIAPENGVISINLPLTPSRTCSNSTKTMHPYFIKRFQNALGLMGVDVKIDNPYLLKTKGEMLIENKNIDLIKQLATKTLSCSHGGGHTSTWINRDSLNCGYCIPCTIRRASINKFSKDLDKCSEYGHKLHASEINLNSSEKKLDILALSYFLNKELTKDQLIREVKLMAKIDDVDQVADMLLRGYTEIKEYIHDKADTRIKGLFTCQLV